MLPRPDRRDQGRQGKGAKVSFLKKRCDENQYVAPQPRTWFPTLRRILVDQKYPSSFTVSPVSFPAMAQSPLVSCSRLDDSFGPHAGDCRGGFDFTLLFEETILTIIPAVILLLVLPARVQYLWKRVRKIDGGNLSATVKIVRTGLHHACDLDITYTDNLSRSDAQSAWTVLAVLQLAALILWATPSATRTRTTLAAAALTLVSTIGFCLLSYAEHTRAVRPSSILNSYLLVTLLFDIAHARTLWLRAADHLNQVIAYLATTAVVVKSIILVLEALDKRRVLRPDYRSYPPEATSNIYSRYLFWWLNPLFRQGFGHELEVDDLFVLDKHLQASYCYNQFQSAWSSGESLCNFCFFFSLPCFLIFPPLAFTRASLIPTHSPPALNLPTLPTFRIPTYIPELILSNHHLTSPPF